VGAKVIRGTCSGNKPGLQEASPAWDQTCQRLGGHQDCIDDVDDAVGAGDIGSGDDRRIDVDVATLGFDRNFVAVDGFGGKHGHHFLSHNRARETTW